MILYFICGISLALLSFDKVQQKFGKIFEAYKNLLSSANILKDFVGGKNLFSLVVDKAKLIWKLSELKS